MEDFITFDTLCKIRQKGYKCNNARFEGHIYDVLKWLREEKGYHICIGYDGIYSYDVVRIIDCEFAGADDDYDTYEQATLTGIEYVIDNLI